MSTKAKLIQIYFKDEQEASCYSFAELYFNERLTIFWENEVIKKMVLVAETEKISVCSWRLKEKMKYNIRRPRELTQEILESDYDVLSMTGNTINHVMLRAADKWHTGFTEALRRIGHLCDIHIPKEVKIPIYQNHFSATREIYQDYVKNYLIPFMWVMENDLEVNKMVMVDSNYAKLRGDQAASAEYLQAQIGVPYYPLAPFILERLFSVYCTNKKINVTWL